MDLDRTALKKKLISRYIMGLLLLGMMFFIPAGTIRYWQAWIYLGILFIPVAMVGLYFYRRNPEFLERRMRLQEKEKTQRGIVKYSSIIFLAGLLIPGFDYRYGWSEVPVYLVAVSDMVVLLAYLLIVYVFRTNQFAARTVQVDEGQEVITNGPYKLVRHPMYTGMILLYLLTPTALGSLWGLIPFSVLPVILVIRILNEEEVLRRELPGYKEYCRETRFRLIPFIW